jgi:hypothetical protein
MVDERSVALNGDSLCGKREYENGTHRICGTDDCSGEPVEQTTIITQDVSDFVLRGATVCC